MAIPVIAKRASLFHAPQPNKDFEYRAGTGLMPSAEWSVFFDDFLQPWIPATAITNGPVANTPSNWQGAIIDSGATVAVNTTAAIGANGVLTIADATASEGAAIYGQKTIQLTVGKRFWMEARVRTDDITDNTLQFGLSALTATTNPEDLWSTTATDLIAFGLGDGDSNPKFFVDAGNSGTSQQVQTEKGMSVDTWHVLAFHYDGAQLHGYVDGRKALTWSGAASTVPTGVALAPFFGALSGNGAGGNLNVFDYVRWVSER